MHGWVLDASDACCVEGVLVDSGPVYICMVFRVIARKPSLMRRFDWELFCPFPANRGTSIWECVDKMGIFKYY